MICMPKLLQLFKLGVYKGENHFGGVIFISHILFVAPNPEIFK